MTPQRPSPLLFAPYAPRASKDAVAHPPAPPPRTLVIAPATQADLDGIARVNFQRQGGTYEQARVRTEQWLAAPADQHLFLVARAREIVVGYGRAGFVREQRGEFDVPPGWYLMGVVVEEAYRRRGIATELTRRRLDWVAQRGAAEAYYFVNSLNLASIDLHHGFGFEEIRRDFRFPGVTFSAGGHGLLFRVWLSGNKEGDPCDTTTSATPSEPNCGGPAAG